MGSSRRAVGRQLAAEAPPAARPVQASGPAPGRSKPLPQRCKCPGGAGKRLGRFDPRVTGAHGAPFAAPCCCCRNHAFTCATTCSCPASAAASRREALAKLQPSTTLRVARKAMAWP